MSSVFHRFQNFNEEERMFKDLNNAEPIRSIPMRMRKIGETMMSFWSKKTSPAKIKAISPPMTPVISMGISILPM